MISAPLAFPGDRGRETFRLAAGPPIRQRPTQPSIEVGVLLKREDGFTLVEVLGVLALIAVLLGVAGAALRGYWIAQNLEKARDELVTEMRNAQQRSMSESHPVVFGIRLKPGSANWGIVRYDPREPAGTQCKSVGDLTFSGLVRVKEVTGFDSSGAADIACSQVYPSYRFAFFFARGSSVAGDVTLRSLANDNTKEIGVSGITGRVTSE